MRNHFLRAAANRDIEVVTSGLVLYLDAGDSNSYPGSGTDWYDLSNSGINGTLVNGPTYDSGDGGSIVFDGNDDYVNLGTIATSSPLQLASGLTISFWLVQDGLGDDFQRVIDKSNAGRAANGWAVYFLTGATGVLTLAYNGTDGVINSTSSTSTVNWQNWSITWDSTSGGWVWYLNGSADSSGSTTYGIPTVQTTARIGTWNHSTGREYKGKIASCLIYSRALTASEITQNYDALKGRFGLS
jgi:hypothetical protein